MFFHLNRIPGIIACVGCCSLLSAQTIIINPANATGTSGANGSFENAANTFAANGWTVVNGATNRWFTGTQSSCAGTRGAYVGTASGSNDYATNVTDISHFYTDVAIPAGQTCITLTFNWKSGGETGADGLRIYLGSTAATPVANTLFTTTDGTANQIGNTWYNLQATCATATITIPAAFAGTTKRLVFSWQNNNSTGANPGATIDAVSLTSRSPVPTCATGLSPSNGATNTPTCGSLSWTAPASAGCNGATSYDVYFGTSATPPFLVNTTATSYSPPMAFNTTYYWQVRPKNSAGTAAGCAVQSFTTGAPTNPRYNLLNNATSSSPYDCVTLTANINGQRGCAWAANSTLDFLTDFSYDMDINLGSNNGGADGMTFVMHNDPMGRCKCGDGNEGLGARGITKSVIVEIDTYMNQPDRDDFVSPPIGCNGTEDPDHLDIWFNGEVNPDDWNCFVATAWERAATPHAVRLQSSPGVNYNIDNGANHKFRITWNAATSTFTAAVLNSALTLTYGTISSTFDPLTIFGTNTPYFGFTASTGGLANEQSFCMSSVTTVALPVELSDFQALCVSGQSIIQWNTVTERDNAYFEIEKSCDGVNFMPFGSYPGSGTSTDPHAYTAVDADPCPGMNDYRLSQTDTDGNKHFLDVRSVESCLKATDVLVYPNPATDVLTVAWSGGGIDRLTVFNSLGQPVLKHDEDPGPDKPTVQLDVSGLERGIYYLTVYGSNSSRTVKLTIE